MPSVVIILPCNKKKSKAGLLMDRIFHLVHNYGIDFAKAYDMMVRVDDTMDRINRSKDAD